MPSLTRVQKGWIAPVVAICAAPVFLGVLGVDFGTPQNVDALASPAAHLNAAIPGWSVFCAAIATTVLALVSFRASRGRERDRRQLRQALETTDAIIEHVPFGVMIVGNNRRIRRMNRAALDCLGWREDEVLQRPCTEVACVNEQNCPLTNAEAAHESVRCELTASDGQRIPVLKSVTPIALDGESCLLEAFWDLREQAKIELALADRTVELERVNSNLRIRNAELDEFTYAASHDLQEPLRKLKSFSAILSRDLDATLTPRARKDLNFIMDAAERMQTLVQDLLKFSRIGREAMKHENVSISECVDQALEALSMRVQETGAQVTRDRLPEVRGHPVMLTSLYQNLISNALKFVGEASPKIHLTAEPNGRQVTLGVRDHGIGLKPEYAKQIFAPFKRLHGRSEYPGTGIGLAICRKAVERHDGKIWVESEPGAGAHFKFTLPLARKETSS